MLDAANRKGPRTGAVVTTIESQELLTDHQALSGWRQVVSDYVALTKPKIISLLLVTTLGAMMIADKGFPSPWIVIWTLIGGALASGGAGAVNHFIDRDIDKKMGRTKGRPVVAGRVAPWQALAFGIALEVISFALLATAVNVLSAVLALGGYLFYVVVYTLWLKRITPQNIVIGGAAGAFPPLVGWAAATGSLSLGALVLFAIVFFWTPPHFWALALLIRGDYERANVPMLPVVRGAEETRKQIMIYTVIMIATTLLPLATKTSGLVYLVLAIALGGKFLYDAILLMREQTQRAARRLYLYSLLYLALLFLAMVIDHAIIV